MYEDFFFITEENIDSFLKAPKKIRGELTIIAELYSSNEKIYSDQEIINELKKLKPSQVSAMLSKSSSQSRDILYKRCMDLLNEKFLKNKISSFFIVVSSLWLLASCSQVIVGGATSTSMIIVQERSSKQAAIDILIKAKIEEAMFSNDYDKLFSKVRVIVYEGRVLLVGTVVEESIKETANQISWNTKNVNEVANYITIGKNDLIDYVKDTRISLELRAKMLTDKEVSEVNFSVTTENRILYLVGVAQNNKELNKVIEHASNIAGVKKIVNLIKLKNLKDE